MERGPSVQSDFATVPLVRRIKRIVARMVLLALAAVLVAIAGMQGVDMLHIEAHSLERCRVWGVGDGVNYRPCVRITLGIE